MSYNITILCNITRGGNILVNFINYRPPGRVKRVGKLPKMHKIKKSVLISIIRLNVIQKSGSKMNLKIDPLTLYPYQM